MTKRNEGCLTKGPAGKAVEALDRYMLLQNRLHFVGVSKFFSIRAELKTIQEWNGELLSL